MNKMVLSLGLLLLVSSCGDNPFAPDDDWGGTTYYGDCTYDPHSEYIDYDGGMNDCNYARFMNDTTYGGGAENLCCCNPDASNYSEDGWNCNSEDNTYCIFD